MERRQDDSIQALLEQLNKLDTEGWFAQPVDPVALGLPDYFDVIKKPMDLGTVSKRLEDKFYKNDTEALADILLTLNNSMTYNQRFSPAYKLAARMMNLAKAFERGEFGTFSRRPAAATTTTTTTTTTTQSASSTPPPAGASDTPLPAKRTGGSSSRASKIAKMFDDDEEHFFHGGDAALDEEVRARMRNAVFPVIPGPGVRRNPPDSVAYFAFEPSVSRDLQAAADAGKISMDELTLPGIATLCPKGDYRQVPKSLPINSTWDLAAFSPATSEDMHAMEIVYKSVIGDAAGVGLSLGPNNLPLDTEPDEGFTGFRNPQAVRCVMQITIPAEDFFICFQKYATPEQRKRFHTTRDQGHPRIWVSIPTIKLAKNVLGVLAVRAWVAAESKYTLVTEPHLLSLSGNRLTLKAQVALVDENTIPKELSLKKSRGGGAGGGGGGE